MTDEYTSDALIARVRSELPTHLVGHRLTHTFGVEEEILFLGGFFMPEEETAAKHFMNDLTLAAYLHDITKQKEQMPLCERFGIDAAAVSSPEILHAYTGAHFAREVYGVNDTVFRAVYAHTTGKTNMTLPEELLFLADFTEKGRTHDSCKTVRAYIHDALSTAKKDERLCVLHTACVKSIDSTLRYLIDTGRAVEPDTVFARNDLLEKMNPEGSFHGKQQ